MDYMTMKFNDIVQWCKDNNQVAWLKDAAKPNANGKRPTFIKLKKEFASKFMPDIMPTKQPKAPTMYDIIDSL